MRRIFSSIGWFSALTLYMSLLAFCLLSAHAQNPQSSTAPIYATNAKYANGVAPGYYPTQQAVGGQSAATGLNINIGPGTANCAGTMITYTGGQFTMTASSVNYIYLNTASSCAVAVKTTSYTSSDIPVAMVTAGSSTLSSILDDRTIFNVPGSGSSIVNSFNTRTGAVTLTASDVNGVGGITNNTSGNAATATALASTPSQCPSGQAAQGIATNGNAQGCQAVAGGSGPQYATGNAVFVSASLWMVDATNNCAVGGNYRLQNTAYTITGTNQFTGTYTSSGTLSVGNIIRLNQYGTSTFLNGQTVTVSSLGSGTYTGTLSPGHANTSATENGEGDCAGDVPDTAATLPWFNNVNVVNRAGGGGWTANNILTQYATDIHPWTTSVTTQPSYLYLMPSGNDWAGSCPTVATVEGDYTAWMAMAHADGAKVYGTGYMRSIAPNLISCPSAYATFAGFEKWWRQQGKGLVAAATIGTTATAGSGSSTITVASATGISKYQAVTGANIPTDTYVTNVSGTTITISQNTSGSLSSTPVVFYNGYWDSFIDLHAAAYDSSYYAPSGGLAGHPLEYATNHAASMINQQMSSGGGEDTYDPLSFSNGVANYFGGNPLYVYEPTNNFDLGLFTYVSGGTDYFYLGEGGGNAANAGNALFTVSPPAANRYVVLNGANVGLGANNSTSGAGPVVTAADTGLTRGAAGQWNAGQGGAMGDETGGFGSTWIHTALSTAPTGSCTSGQGGRWEKGADGTESYCPTGGGTWTSVLGGSVAFSTLISGTNTTAAMVLGSGASLAPSGTGSIQATNISGTVAASSPITLSGSGTTASPYTLACPTCGTSTSTAVNNNSGSTLGTSQQDGFLPYKCADSSGSGTSQTCTTTTSFTPSTGNCWVYTTTTANSGTALTVSVDSVSKSVAVPGTSGWTTTLTATSSVPANKPLLMCYDGTNFNVAQTGTVAGSGSYPTPETHTASNSAALQFTTCLSSSYKSYQIRFINIVMASDNLELLMQLSINGGSTYDNTSGHYIRGNNYFQLAGGTASGYNVNNSTSLGLSIAGTGVYTSGVYPLNATYTLNDPNSSTQGKMIHGTFDAAFGATTSLYSGAISSSWTQTTAVNAFQIIASSGNITSGTVVCQPLPQ